MACLFFCRFVVLSHSVEKAIDNETMCREFVDEYLGKNWEFTYEETETTLTITRDNGAYYTVDRGVEPHYYFGKLESYYDREALTAHINGLK